MEEMKDSDIYQSPGQILGSAGKKHSILKQTKRMPLQPLLMNFCEDEDTTTTTTTMTMSHQRKVSFSVGTQIKEFRSDTEGGISEGWGSSYEVSLKSDSTRSSENSSSCSEHNGCVMQSCDVVTRTTQVKLDMISSDEHALSDVRRVPARPSPVILNTQESRHQQLTSKTRTLEINDDALHFDMAVQSVSGVVVDGGSQRLTPGGGDSLCVHFPNVRSLDDHFLSENSRVHFLPEACHALAVEPSSDVREPSYPPVCSALTKSTLCLLSPSTKYSKKVCEMLVDDSDESLSEKSLGEGGIEETCCDLPCYSFTAGRGRCENLPQSAGENFGAEIFFPVLCSTSQAATMNCSQESISMELTDVLPALQVPAHCREACVMDCVEPQPTRGNMWEDRLGVNGDVKQLGLAAGSLSVTESARGEEGQSADLWLLEHDSPLVRSLKDVATVVEEPVAGLQRHEECDGSGVKSCESMDMLFPCDCDYVPAVGACEAAGSSAGMNGSSRSVHEMSLTSTEVCAAKQLSNFQERGGHLRFDHWPTTSEDSRPENGLDTCKATFKRLITDDASTELCKKRFHAADPIMQEVAVSACALNALVQESSSSYVDDISKREKSSLHLESSDVSTLWQLHTDQSDTNYEDDTSRLLAAKVCINSLEELAEPSQVHSTSPPVSSSPTSSVPIVNCEEAAASVATNADVQGDCESIVRANGVNEDREPLGCNMHDAETCASLEGSGEKCNALSSAEFCNEKLSAEEKESICDKEALQSGVNSHFLAYDKVNDSLYNKQQKESRSAPLVCASENCNADSETSDSNKGVVVLYESCADVCFKDGTSVDSRQDEMVQPCTGLVCNDISNTKQNLKSVNNVSSTYLDFNTTGEGFAGGISFNGELSSVEELSGGRLFIEDVNVSAFESKPPHNEGSITTDDGEYHKTICSSLEISNLLMGEDDVNDLLGIVTKGETICGSSGDAVNQAESSKHDSSAGSAGGIAGRISVSSPGPLTGSARVEERTECVDVEIQHAEAVGVTDCHRNPTPEASIGTGCVVERTKGVGGAAKDGVGMIVFTGNKVVTGEDTSSLGLVRNQEEGVELKLSAAAQLERGDGVSMNIDQLSGISSHGPVVKIEVGNNVCSSVCNSSLVEDFGVENSADELKLAELARSTDRVPISTSVDESHSFPQQSVCEVVNQPSSSAGKYDICCLNLSEKQGDCASSDKICGDSNQSLNEPHLEAVAGAICVVMAEDVSAVAASQCCLAEATVPNKSEMLYDINSQGNLKMCGDFSAEAGSTGGLSTSISDTPNTCHEPSFKSTVSVENFLDTFSKSEDCAWTLKTKDKEEWVFQFLFSSLDLVMKLASEHSESQSTHTTVTDIYLYSRITERTDPLAHLVHYIILRKFASDSLKSWCETVKDAPRVLQLLSDEMDDMIIFMLDFDVLEKTGKLSLKDKCVVIRMSHCELPSLFDVNVNIDNWGAICEADVSITSVVGAVREEDIQRLVSTVPQGPRFLSQYVLAIEDYLRHLAMLNKQQHHPPQQI